MLDKTVSFRIDDGIYKDLLKIAADKQKSDLISANITDIIRELIEEKIQKETISSINIYNKKINDKNPFSYVDIFEFCESPYYLNIKLWPWQKLILKIFYMGLDGNRHLELTQNEWEMINNDLSSDSDSIIDNSVKDQVINKIGAEFNELLLVMGRRSSKSTIEIIISLYETYRLIEMGSPQGFLGDLKQDDDITILYVSFSEQQAKYSFDRIKTIILNSPYFKNKMSPNSIDHSNSRNRSVKFWTAQDLSINQKLDFEILPQKEGSICLLSTYPNENLSDSTMHGLCIVIIDEMASSINNELYNKFKKYNYKFDKNGKIICTSTPISRDGKFFELYEQSFYDNRILMIQLPSCKVNPTLDQKSIDLEREQAYKTGQSDAYNRQIEARFI